MEDWAAGRAILSVSVTDARAVSVATFKTGLVQFKEEVPWEELIDLLWNRSLDGSGQGWQKGDWTIASTVKWDWERASWAVVST